MKLAAILAAAACFVLGVAVGVRRPCPEPMSEREQAYMDYIADAEIQPPDPWPVTFTVRCSCPLNRGDNYFGTCLIHDVQSTYNTAYTGYTNTAGGIY